MWRGVPSNKEVWLLLISTAGSCQASVFLFPFPITPLCQCPSNRIYETPSPTPSSVGLDCPNSLEDAKWGEERNGVRSRHTRVRCESHSGITSGPWETWSSDVTFCRSYLVTSCEVSRHVLFIQWPLDLVTIPQKEIQRHLLPVQEVREKKNARTILPPQVCHPQMLLWMKAWGSEFTLPLINGVWFHIPLATVICNYPHWCPQRRKDWQTN